MTDPAMPASVVDGIRAKAPQVAILLLCKPRDVKFALDTLKKGGAQDYLVQGTFDAILLPRIIKNAVDRQRLRNEITTLKKTAESHGAQLEMAEKALSTSQERIRAQSKSLEKANADLQQKNTELQKLDQLKSQFLSMVSHDLKSPLAVINGYIGLLTSTRTAEPLTAAQKDKVDKIQESADRLLKLISEILTLSQLESGKVNLQYQQADAGALVKSVAESLKVVAAKKKQEIRIDIPLLLPQMSLDMQRIERVVSNLITNAHKYTPEGGWIRVRVKQDGDMMRFEVGDSGPGIPAGKREMIFDRFSRIGDKDRPDGAPNIGLGLAICKEIVSQHRGRIWVEAEEAGGSLFVFQLPLEARAKRGAARDILIVEDDPNVRSFLEEALSAGGHQVTAFDNGLHAIEHIAAKTKRFDIVFTDLNLPGANGVQVIESVKESQPQAQVAVMTSHTNSDIFFEAMSHGPMTFIAKPFTVDQLQHALSKLLAV